MENNSNENPNEGGAPPGQVVLDDFTGEHQHAGSPARDNAEEHRDNNVTRSPPDSPPPIEFNAGYDDQDYSDDEFDAATKFQLVERNKELMGMVTDIHHKLRTHTNDIDRLNERIGMMEYRLRAANRPLPPSPRR